MIGRLWIIGAFVTSLASSALLTVLLFHFFRSRSRLAIAFAVLICGGMFHVIGEFSRLVPDFRIFVDQPDFGDKVLSTLGAGLTTYGLANIVVELTVQTRMRSLRLGIILPGLAAGILCGFGKFTDSFLLIGYAYLLECAIGFFSALFILIRQKLIVENHVRQLAVVICWTCIVLIPFSSTRLLLKINGKDIFLNMPSSNLAPWVQLILMFAIVATALIFSGRWLIRTVRIHRETLNPLAVRQYHLSPRERDIVLEIARGRSNEEIASMLFISVSTVKNHIYHIYGKLKIHNRVELLNAVMKKD